LWVGQLSVYPAAAGLTREQGGDRMIWIKPEFKEVAVTLEVTAYAGRK
jgi:coenzyme PQQ precursor peptide PqqA